MEMGHARLASPQLCASAAVGEGVKEGCGDDIIDTDPYSPSIRSQTRAVFGFFHPETRFQKSAFSGSAFAGFVWTVGPNDAKHVRLHKKTFPCGWPLKQHCKGLFCGVIFV